MAMNLAGLRRLALRGGMLAACLMMAEFSHRHGGPAWIGLLALAAIGSACLGPLFVAADGAPHRAARLAMLPMMAGLPWLADACGAAGWPASAVWGLHLAVMLPPPLLLPRTAIALLLVAGGVALAAWPGVQGLMAAMLLHGAAWSLAAQDRPAVGPSRGLQAALAALGLLALGLAIEARGLAPLLAAHAVLALGGVAGLIPMAAVARAWRQNAPHARHRHP